MEKTREFIALWGTIMKVSILQLSIILLTAAYTYGGYEANAQELLMKPVSVQFTDTDIKTALSELELKANVKFVYTSRLVPLKRKVTLRVVDKSIAETLDALFSPDKVTYKIVRNRILLSVEEHEKSTSLESTDLDNFPALVDRTVKGRVTDEQGDGLPGVSVVLKGSQRGTISNTDGTYELIVPDGANTLIFSFVGYLTQEIDAGTRAIIDVGLEADEKSLEEVVVVGYGTQKKATLTGAVSALNEKDFGRRQVGQSSLLLQGTAPGVTVTQRSGQPGRDGGAIRIRGIGTLSDSNPLVLVDGVEMSINNIDPGTIDNISVLKDAASSAIYGSRAANGVVLVTTKRAKKNQTSLTYNGYYGWEAPTNLPKKVNAIDHMKYHDIAYVNSGRSPIFANQIREYEEDGGANPDLFPDTDWMDLLLNTGKKQNHLLAFNKGFDKLSVATSFAYFKQDGLITNSSFERLTFRLNSDMEIAKNLTAKVDVMITHLDRPEPISENKTVNDIFFQMYRIPSNQPAVFSNGLYGEGWSDQNPLAWANVGGTERLKSPSASLNFQFDYKPTSWLSADFVFSPIYTVNHTKSFVKAITLHNPDGSVFAERPSLSTLNESFARTLSKTLRATVKVEESVGRHYFKILGGISQEDYVNHNFRGYREVFLLPDYEVLDAGGQSNKDSRGTASDWALRSFFGRLNYELLDRYLLEVTARYDGSSRFSSKNRYALFPSVSAAWRLSEEKFMDGIKSALDDVKIRASWGTLGNQNIGGTFYPYVSSIPLTVNYTFGNSLVSGARMTELANSDLKWEETEMWNLGIDFRIAGKINVTADYFSKTTSDILLRLNIPGSLGLDAPFQNAGTVRNKGFELGINYSDQIGALNYSITAAASDVKNKILDLKGISSTALTQNRQGYAMNSLFGHVAEGYFQDSEDITNSPKQFGIEMFPGDIKYKDLDDNGVIDDNDRTIFGNTIPRYTYSLNLNLNFKQFDLGVFLQGVGKADGYLYQSAIMPFFNGGTMYEYHKDYWTDENPGAAFPRLSFNAVNNQKNSSFWMNSAAYLRLKNVQLGYTIPSGFASKLGIRSFRFYVTGENMLTFDRFWDGFDVEAPVGTGNFYPLVKTYTFGLNLNL